MRSQGERLCPPRLRTFSELGPGPGSDSHPPCGKRDRVAARPSGCKAGMGVLDLIWWAASPAVQGGERSHGRRSRPIILIVAQGNLRQDMPEVAPVERGCDKAALRSRNPPKRLGSGSMPHPGAVGIPRLQVGEDSNCCSSGRRTCTRPMVKRGSARSEIPAIGRCASGGCFQR